MDIAGPRLSRLLVSWCRGGRAGQGADEESVY